jgi:hypothetical protein
MKHYKSVPGCQDLQGAEDMLDPEYGGWDSSRVTQCIYATIEGSRLSDWNILAPGKTLHEWAWRAVFRSWRKRTRKVNQVFTCSPVVPQCDLFCALGT